MRRLLITLGLALTLVVLNSGAAGARDSRRPPPPLPTTSAILTASTTPSGTHFLRGEKAFDDGVPSYIFGTNDTINYGTPNFDTLSSAQAAVKGAGLSLDRMWAYSRTDTDASILARVHAAEHSGMTCMFMLGQTDDLTWLEHVVSITDNYCNLYEFGNEPDNGGSPAGGSIATYTSQWIADIPVLRAEDPSALFGGPTIMWSGSCCQFTGGGYTDDMAYFLAKTAAAGVRADFITYHDYPCTAGKQDTTAACLSATPGDLSWNWNNVIPYEQRYYGAAVPTGVTEYNFDPGDQHLYDWCNNATFMTQWTTAAVDEIARLGMSFANQFDSLNWGGYGCYDMFSDGAPYRPKPQFNAMVSEIAKYTSFSTQVLVPPNGASLRGRVVLDASAVGPRTVTGVSFELSGGSLSKPVVVGTAVATLYGWIALWKTTSMANGTYSLQSMATETGGTTAKSPKITVKVSN